ncbi:MAG: CHASE2 domain-containing protein [Cyanobacteriota bacterium]
MALLLEILPAAVAVALLLLLRQSGLTERANLFAYDLAVQLRTAPSGAATPVRIIGIDERDLARYGSQVPDALLAEAVERLDRLGVRAIGLDMFCGQPVGSGGARLRQLASTNPRLVSIYFELDGKRAIPGTPRDRQANADLYIDPQDGVLRRDVLHVTEGPRARSVSLPLRLLQIARGRREPWPIPRFVPNASSLLGVGAGGYLPNAGVSAPDYQQRMLFFHQPGSFPTWSLRALLRDPLPESMIQQLRSSIVLIGVVAPSSKDAFAVPFSPWRAGQRRFEIPGVEIHAHRLSALLRLEAGESPGLQAAPRAVNVLLLLLGVGAGFLVGEGIANLRRAFLVAALVLPLAVGAVALALAMGVWVDGALPLLAFVLVASAGWLRRGVHQQIRGVHLERLNRQARTLFNRFVSRNVADVLLEAGNPGAAELQLRQVTILMSDLRGFSLMTAEHPPAVVVRLLNNYLEVMFGVVEQFGGTIDEVLGDALLVLFGAPQPRPDHAEAAIACAIQMQLAMERVNSGNRQQNLPELAMGIGLCTGEVMAGTIGSGLRAKYAVVGAAVNLAARIEALTVGGEIFADETTVSGVAAPLRIDGQHHWLVKGAGEALRVSSIGAIAGAYNLALPSGSLRLRSLAKPLRATYQRIQSKTRQGPPRETFVTHLSEAGAWLAPHTSDLEPFSDLVLLFFDPPGEIYAKVREGQSPERVRVVFTTTPGPFRAWLRSLEAGEAPQSPP